MTHRPNAPTLHRWSLVVGTMALAVTGATRAPQATLS